MPKSAAPTPKLAPKPTLLWFRRDLRLADNPALAEAAASGAPVIPVYVLDEGPDVRPLGGALQWWLDRSLAALDEDLRRRGSRLILRRGEAVATLTSLVRETGAGRLLWNRLPDPESPREEAELARAMATAGVETEAFNAAFLVEPGAVTTGSGGVYKVFTPFWRAARVRIGHPDIATAPDRLAAPESWPASDDRTTWRLSPTRPDWSSGFDVWTPGEAGAQARLERFVDEALGGYAQGRERPAAEGSSRLSPHLRWGEIGPRQVWRAVEAAVARQGQGEGAAETFFAELGWREFNSQILAARPDLATVDVKPLGLGFRWRRDPKGLEAWRRGRTGYPVVDAGMRELWATGWMHNRVRMITASFLVKHLLVDWREGEAWFWDTLVDADPANNPANWQWSAGVGADASPFFRIFNPVLQGERFDPRGDYVRRWVPELARLPNTAIHAPWSAPADVLARAGVGLGDTYPKPIVDHAAARERALSALKSAKGRSDDGG